MEMAGNSTETADGSGGGSDPQAYKLLLQCPYGVSPSELAVEFDQIYDRVPHPDALLENCISEIWDKRVQQNPSLYNGLKFRYGGHTFSGRVDPSQKHGICLHLGLTDYRTFVGTNLNPSWERFLFPSEDDTRRCQHTSNPLGNGAIVETSDKEIVLLQRSANVGEFAGHFVFPGGHPEPQEIGITSYEAAKGLTYDTVNGNVSQEMFDSIIREVVEEIGVPANALSTPVFIGISQRALNVRTTAFFYIKCSLGSKEIRQLYQNAQDGFESTHIYTMPLTEVAVAATKMPGCHVGGFALYKLMLEAKTLPRN